MFISIHFNNYAFEINDSLDSLSNRYRWRDLNSSRIVWPRTGRWGAGSVTCSSWPFSSQRTVARAKELRHHHLRVIDRSRRSPLSNAKVLRPDAPKDLFSGRDAAR